MKESTAPKAITWNLLTTLLVTAGIFFGGQIIGAGLLSIVLGFFGVSSEQIAKIYSSSTLSQFTLMITVDIAMFLLLFWFIRARKSSLQALGLIRPKLRDGLYVLAGAVIYFSASALLSSVVAKLIPALNLDQQQQIGFQQASSAPQLVLVFIALVIFPPFVEELVFRGFLFSGLKTKLPLVFAAPLTSVIFAAPHLQIGSGEPLLWTAFIDTFILSLVLVSLRIKTGNLWTSIGLHALKNGVAFTALFILKLA